MRSAAALAISQLRGEVISTATATATPAPASSTAATASDMAIETESDAGTGKQSASASDESAFGSSPIARKRKSTHKRFLENDPYVYEKAPGQTKSKAKDKPKTIEDESEQSKSDGIEIANGKGKGCGRGRGRGKGKVGRKPKIDEGGVTFEDGDEPYKSRGRNAAKTESAVIGGDELDRGHDASGELDVAQSQAFASSALAATVGVHELLDLMLPLNLFEYYDMWYKRRVAESDNLLKLGVDVAGFSLEAEVFVNDLLTETYLSRFGDLAEADPERTLSAVSKTMLDLEGDSADSEGQDSASPASQKIISNSRSRTVSTPGSAHSSSPGQDSTPQSSRRDQSGDLSSEYLAKKKESLDISVRLEIDGYPCRIMPQVNLVDKLALRDGFNVDQYAFPRETDERFREGTYVNCDLRYFNLSCLGKFDVIMMDPPWRIRGGEREMGEQTLFSNTSFKHEYYTLSNQEILDIDIGVLSDKGLIFLWVINSQLPFAFECLNKWGYEYVDKLTWIKTTRHFNIAIGPGYHFLHSTEICLVGFKCPKGETTQFIGKVNNDIIFGPVREKSRKPDQIYHVIERMAPGSRKVEVFARNHNIRRGWLSLGNQLGEYYDYTRDRISCNGCEKDILIAQTRYKSKRDGETDYCHNCFIEKDLPVDDYFVLKNTADNMIFHEYYQCDECGSDPLPGVRFKCIDCGEYDMCEWCYDKMMAGTAIKSLEHRHHNFETIEMPEKAAGYQVHYERCTSCQQYPIIGVLVRCMECAIGMCQKCFYLKREPKLHKSEHDIQIVLVPQEQEDAKKPTRCDVCRIFPIVGARYACNSCFRYTICSKCHDSKASTFRFPSHRPYHTFSKIE